MYYLDFILQQYILNCIREEYNFSYQIIRNMKLKKNELSNYY